MVLNIVLLLVLLLLSFITSGAEVALFSLQSKDVNMLKTKQHAAARRITTLLDERKAVYTSLLKMGAIMGGAGERNQNFIYEFGRKLGLAFQVQDDYLDAFGDPQKFGKQVGGDIKANKKTFCCFAPFLPR